MIREITCIVCPRGCHMTAEITEKGIAVAGNSCSRGKKHAIGECTNPVRTLTASVRVSNRRDTMVSIKSEAPVPKGQLLRVMAQIHTISVEAPISAGDVILRGICGTNLIATKEIL